MISPVSKIQRITSRQNPLVEEIVEIRKGKDNRRIFLEGEHLIQEAVSSGLVLETFVMYGADSTTPGSKPVTPPVAKTILEVTASVMNLLSDVATPPGQIAIATRPQRGWDSLFKNELPLLVVLDGLQDPGNAAAIVRTAEAAGVSGVVTTPSTAKLFSPKALRGAMGSSLRVPILEHQPVATILMQLQAQGCPLFAADAERPDVPFIRYTELPGKTAIALVFGQEGRGLSEVWGTAVQRVSIPMKKPVESLNVAAAAAILLYEIARQR